MANGYAGAQRWKSRQFADYDEEAGYGRDASRGYLERASNFDASKAVNTYARGAWGSISKALGHELTRLGGNAVGQGRFDSGFYDEDQGVVINNATDQFNDAIAQQSVTAAGMDLRNAEGLASFGSRARENASEMAASQREIEENAWREEQARKRRRRGGIASAIGQTIGGVGGFFLGGPAGAAAGARIGGGLGQSMYGD